MTRRLLEGLEVIHGERNAADTLHRIRTSAEEWLARRGIRQWNVGEVPIDQIADQLDAGEWWLLVDRSGAIQAGLRYLSADDAVWSHEPRRAARYVHGLMISRDIAPPGSGAHLLAWAEARAMDEGISVMRLDCVEDNRRLRRFYRDQGYREVGRRDFDENWFSATLFEKNLEMARPD